MIFVLCHNALTVLLFDVINIHQVNSFLYSSDPNYNRHSLSQSRFQTISSLTLQNESLKNCYFAREFSMFIFLGSQLFDRLSQWSSPKWLATWTDASSSRLHWFRHKMILKISYRTQFNAWLNDGKSTIKQ